MTRKQQSRAVFLLALLALALLNAACSHDTQAAATKAEITVQPGVFTVQHPELFSLTKIETRLLPMVLNANGAVNPDVTRTIHVTSMGSGRAIELNARLGDSVKKGQVLLVISSADLGTATADYQKARADEELSRKALDRAQLLYSRGALAEKDLQLAQDAEDKAKIDLHTAEQRVRILGGDPNHPAPLIELRAPVSGTIVEQNVAGFEGIRSLDNSPTLFTIADLSQVWVICDVYENDLGEVHVGDSAEIHLNAFPDRIFHGKIGDISRLLDPNTRSAKVRIVLPNPDGSLRPGMYVTATLRSRKLQPHLVVPSTAIMRLQDKDWIFRQEKLQRFQQVEVHVIAETHDGIQQIQNGAVKPGEEVVLNALEFSAAMAGQGK